MVMLIYLHHELGLQVEFLFGEVQVSLTQRCRVHRQYDEPSCKGIRCPRQ